MRSRYSAYCLADTHYLLATLHSSEHTPDIAAEIDTFANSVHFCRLTISSASQTAEHGQVSFAAYFLHEQKLDVIEEVSDFIYKDRWYYKSGLLNKADPIKIGRNELCPCGSGKKFKQCVTHRLSGQLIDTAFPSQ